QLKKNNCMDFADILVNCHKLFEIDEIAEKIASKYKYIMVDEYQDTNDIQYRIVNRIAKKYGNLCVVGDENQSIYGFRGANIKNILDFENDYPDATVIKLEENYRSTSAILDSANAVIKHNTTSRDKKLWTKKEQGEPITLAHCKDGREEAEMVVNRIKELRNSGRGYSDFTILYRTNAQSRNFEEAFLKHNIPYKIFGGMQFYQRAEIKDILSYLTFINNSKDALSFSRIINTPKRKIGDKTLEKIISYATNRGITAFEALENIDDIEGIGVGVKVALNEFFTLITDLKEMCQEYAKVSEIFEKLLAEIGYKRYIESSYPDYEGRLENIDELRNSISELEKIAENLTLGEYLENISLVSATDELEESLQYVKLMTIHNSKGLEFPIVFLTGVEDEIFPGKMADFDNSALEEERRLCYVAITRAEEELVISYADTRYMYGDMSFRTKSRFIKEIPSELLKEKIGSRLEEQRSYSSSYLGRESVKKDSKIENFSLDRFKNMEKNKNYPYSPGEKVMHKKFGLGIVRDMDEKRVIVEFVDGTKEIAAIIADKFLEKHP
ncbi:MAG: ATP-dependent helicase, partial [Fusobacteriaceae bacterium]